MTEDYCSSERLVSKENFGASGYGVMIMKVAVNDSGVV